MSQNANYGNTKNCIFSTTPPTNLPTDEPTTPPTDVSLSLQFPCTATLHEPLREGEEIHTDGVVRIVVDDDTYVFGKRVGNWCKMAAVDRSGKHIKNKYMSQDKELNVANWLTANNNAGAYSVSDVKFCEPEEFTTRDSLLTAVNLWMSNKLQALEEYDVIQNWKTGKVTSMYYLFVFPEFNEDVSKWDTGNVSSMTGTFSGAKAFNGDLSKWNTSSVIAMNSMFWGGADAWNGDISEWDTSRVVNMLGMFHKTYAYNGDLSKWNTNKVVTMRHMFNKATSFNHKLCWNVSGKDVRDMFKLSPGSIGCD